jgi:diguanylate cyclase (GGDEF)-like protein
MSALDTPLAHNGRRLAGRPPAEERKLRLRVAAAFALLLAAALAGGGIILVRQIELREADNVTSRLGLALKAATTEMASEAAAAQEQATSLASQPALQQALSTGDLRTARRLAARVPGALVIRRASPSFQRQSALIRKVDVLAHGRLLGSIAVVVPLDGALLSRLREAAPLASGEGLLLVRGDRILAAPLRLQHVRLPRDAHRVSLDGDSYRIAQATLVSGSTEARLVALAPNAKIEASVGRARRGVVLCLAATFVALLLLGRQLAALALAPLRHLAQQARNSTTDGLTGLANRTGFTALAAAELRRSERSDRPLALAMLDLDDFKQVNDTFGHAAGDDALRIVADVLRMAVREIDILGRYGGEEFVVLFPDTDLTGAYEAAERIRIALGRRDTTRDGRPLPHTLTASIGIAAGRNINAMIDDADRALYRAKQHGKNRVELSTAVA